MKPTKDHLSSKLARTANEVKTYRKLMKLLPLGMGCIAVLTVILYVVSALYARYGSFTVAVDKYQNLEYALTLCENRDFSNPTSRLNCDINKSITCIDGATLDDVPLGILDGDSSGTNYVCYTFYLKNAGESIVNYKSSIVIGNMTLGIENAIRLILLTNRNGTDGTKRVYAMAADLDENNNAIPEPDTIPFYDKYTVCSDETVSFAPGEVCKYTVVLYLEGNDPECVDDILGGEFKIDMKFSITGVTDEEGTFKPLDEDETDDNVS